MNHDNNKHVCWILVDKVLNKELSLTAHASQPAKLPLGLHIEDNSKLKATKEFHQYHHPITHSNK